MTVSTPSPAIAYFHGMPGGPEEWNLCAPPGLDAFAPNRNAPTDPEQLAQAVASHARGMPVTLIGFSLGAPIAVAVANELGPQVAHLHLVSPAAPLQLGDFLGAMAGGPLFQLAAQRPRLFKMVARAESMLAAYAPRFLFDRLFASAAGGDAALRDDAHFRSGMAQVLRDGLGTDWRGFVHEVNAYVTDWRASLASITAPVTIWQGQADTWTPPAMAEALGLALPGPVRFERVPGAAHYSTLKTALSRIA